MERIKPVKLLCVSCLLLMFIVPASLSLKQSRPVVSAIEIRGNQRVRTSTIRGCIESKPNQVLDPETVDRDVRSICRLNFFEKVEARAENEQDGGVLLIFEVFEIKEGLENRPRGCSNKLPPVTR
jgi:outer membrane protein assembly factor BamA